jgi:hypothetical protein
LSQTPELEPILRAVEPAVRLVPERYLRQVLHYLIDWGHLLPTNLDLPYWVARADLEAGDLLPKHILAGEERDLLLISDPDDRMISQLPVEMQLREYWRVLFRAAVMREIDRKVAAGILSEAACLERLEQFGLAAAREVRSVLLAERLIAVNADAVTRYRTFAATYLDLEEFERHAVAHYFPSLPGGDTVRLTLSADVDVAALLARTRPARAAESRPTVQETGIHTPLSSEQVTDRAEANLLLQRAQDEEEKGNHVRAAILRTQAGAGPEAHGSLGRLVEALGAVFSWDAQTRQDWRQALAPLLAPAAHGVWPRAARCLYELQRIPADLSREVFAVDLPETIRTFGRRPVKRPLPHARPVLILMSLKKGQTQLLRAGLDGEAKHRLDRLFHHQIHSLEHDIRRDFTPIVADALASAGLTPTNTVEEVARDKIVAELLDRICERGYLRIGNLRDAIARNRLKMNDLTGPGEFFRGDQLLRADIKLAYALDGVYRKGEFYLRWIQRVSALFFGTAIGRLFTLYIAVPFGGAFMTLMFLEELRHIGGKLGKLISKPAAVTRSSPPAEPKPAVELVGKEQAREVKSDELDVNDDGEIVWVEPAQEENPFLLGNEPGAALVTDVFTSSAPATTQIEQPHASILIAWPTIVGFGFFLLLMFHVSPFRRGVFALFGYLWRVIRLVLWDAPMGLWRSPAVRSFRQSRPVRFMVRHFWSPLLITLLVFAAMLLVVKPLFLLRPWAVYFWAALTLAYNTPWGWVIQDRITEFVSDWWRRIRVNFIPGLIATLIDWFKMLGNWVERQLYAVDEWLRFRGGDSQGSLAVKAVLGLLWFPIAYIFRFVFYLLVEPQVNPVKHFPVVTVSHKVIWPMLPMLTQWTKLSEWTVAAFLNGIPGIFGFIAWELKENWRLYDANRADRLRPVTIGSHGESMRGLLRPGFHSGTIPKVFRKLRHASRSKAAWLHHDLEHTADAIHRFINRELIHLLARSPDWGQLRIEIAAIRFGVQRVVIELAAPGLGRDHFVLALENVGGVIEAAVDQIGWADKLTEPQRGVFVAALRGILDMAAVERIDGQPRVDGPAPLGPDSADLARRVAWTEWVERWSRKEDSLRNDETNAVAVATSAKT